MTTNAKNLVSELPLPCPLCGTNKIKFVGVNRPYWFLRCDKCGCTGGLCMTKDQAQETWNTRAPMLAQAGDAVSEPVGWMTEDGRVATAYTKEHSMPNPSKDMFVIPLYTHPPLTDKESK